MKVLINYAPCDSWYFGLVGETIDVSGDYNADIDGYFATDDRGVIKAGHCVVDEESKIEIIKNSLAKSGNLFMNGSGEYVNINGSPSGLDGVIYEKINTHLAEENALKKQVGGSHYKDLAIQPAYYSYKNNIGHMAGDAIAYITRYKSKGGIEDLRKAIHSIELLIQFEEECQ